MDMQQSPGSQTPQDRDVQENKDIAAVSYLWCMSIIIYLARKDSPFIQYHAKQGIVLFLLSIPVWFIPVVGHFLEFLLLAGMVMGFLNAFQGQKEDVPFIGKVAKGEMTIMQALTSFWHACKRLLGGAKDAVKNEMKKDEKTPPSSSPPSSHV